MTFRVGQKVVCVDAADTTLFGEPELVEGNVYIIRHITGRRGAPCYNQAHAQTVVGFLLKEVPNRRTPFASSRFRPLVERKTETGMAILNSILKGQTKVLEDHQS